MYKIQRDVSLIKNRRFILFALRSYPTGIDLPKVNFKSSDNDIASVSNTGQLITKSIGKCDITATTEDQN
ncbi:Ig-like domain-containing protein [Dysgonomonas sp. HGC4]|nr:Ig-like domain-containing protein [Dysgonomonas sp. HGC4]